MQMARHAGLLSRELVTTAIRKIAADDLPNLFDR